MLHAHQLHDVVNVSEHILDGYRVPCPDEQAFHGDAHDAAPGCQLANGRIGLAARATRHQRTAVRVRDENRLRGGFDHVERRAVAAVRDIGGHAELIHTCQDSLAIFRQAFFRGIGGTASQTIVAIGELRNTLPQLIERVNVVHRAEVIRILLADDDPEFPFVLGAWNVGGTAHADEVFRVRVDKTVPTGDVGRRLGVGVALDIANRGVEDSDAGILEALEIGQAEARRAGSPCIELLEVQGEKPQHIDHGGFAN